MGKDIGRIYKYGQYQLSTLSLKAPGSSSSDPQTASSIELKTTSVPSARNKNQNNSVFIPKMPSRMMQVSQIITTYSLVRQPKKMIAFQPFQHLIIIHSVLLPHPQVY